MSYISATPRGQLMLPSFIDEYVSPDNIVRFIDAFVDKVITSDTQLADRCPGVEGRPGYTPGCLCKLLIYGYLNSISSSRKLENEAGRNLEAIWLMSNLRPDHWTISNFRKENKSLIKRVTVDFRKFLKEQGYLSGQSVSTDGTKIKAYASRDTLSLTLIDKKLAAAEKEVERYLAQLAQSDAAADEQASMLQLREARQRELALLEEQVATLKAQKSSLEEQGLSTLAPADPEAKVMKTKDGFLPCYNVQTTVDNASHFITSCEVTDYPNDFHSLQENVEALQEQLGITPQTVLADGGYANEEQVQALEGEGVEVVVPFPEEPESKKVQRENGVDFGYDAQQDCFTCAQGKKLRLVEKNCKKKNHRYHKYQCKDCSACPIKQLCTTSSVGRIIYRRVDGQWLERYRQKMQTLDFKKKLSRRKCVVEHPFGTMKYYMGQIPILLRGKQQVQVEMNLYATAYNLKHLLSITPVPALLAKLAQWPLAPALRKILQHFLRKFHLFHLFCLFMANDKKIGGFQPVF
jgi:transposase